jgi:hypothetical protein
MNRYLILYTLLHTFFFFSCEKKETALPPQQMARLAPIVDETDPETGALKQKPNKWKNHTCELITNDDLKKLFQEDPEKANLDLHTLPDQAFCLRSWNKPDAQQREAANEKNPSQWLNPQSRLVLQVLGYGTVAAATDQMAKLRRDRRGTYEEDVQNLGDDAVWSTSTVTLLVRRGHLVLSITLEKDDKPHENLNKAKALAEIALPRIW